MTTRSATRDLVTKATSDDVTTDQPPLSKKIKVDDSDYCEKDPMNFSDFCNEKIAE